MSNIVEQVVQEYEKKVHHFMKTFDWNQSEERMKEMFRHHNKMMQIALAEDWSDVISDHVGCTFNPTKEYEYTMHILYKAMDKKYEELLAFYTLN